MGVTAAELALVIRSEFMGGGLAKARAETAAYQKQVTGVGSSTEAVATKTGRNWERIGLGAQNIGRVMNRYVTLPVLAAGAASVVMAVKYDTSMRKVQALAGASQKQMDSYRAAISKIGPATAEGPTQLGDALYFIASAGYKGQRAIDILNISAKGAAIGMGTASDVANTLTSVLKAYSGSGLTAAKSMDILTRTVVLGKMKVTDLIPSLGRILPIAAGMKINLTGVTAALADMTRQGLPATQAVTSLRQIMLSIGAPTAKAVKNGKEMGLSFQHLQQTLRRDGLVAALQEMYKVTGMNTSKMKELGLTSRAIGGYMALMHGHGTQLNAMLAQMTHSAGATDDALKKVSQTMSFKLHQALAKLEYAGVDIGNKLLPTLVHVVNGIDDIAGAWSRMPDSLKTASLWAAGILAIIGPVSSSVAGLVRGFSMMGKGFGGGAAAAGAGESAGGLVAGAGGTVAADTAAIEGAGMGLGTTFAAVAGPLLAGALIGAWVQSGAKPPTTAGAQHMAQPGAVNAGRAAGSFSRDVALNRPGSVAAAQAYVSPLVDKLQLRAYDATGPAFTKIMAKMRALELMASKGITPEIKDPNRPVQALVNMQKALIKTGMTGKQAFKMLEQAFGKSYVDQFKAAITGIGPTTSKAAAKAGAAINHLKLRLLDLAATKAAPTISITDMASYKIAEIKSEIAGLKSKTVTLTAIKTYLGGNGQGGATGAIAQGPKSGYPFTLHGREAVVPLDRPVDAGRVMRHAGLDRGGHGGSVHHSTHSAEHNVSYNIEINLPHGVVTSDVEALGGRLQPFIDRSIQLAEMRRSRGRVV